MTDSPNAFESPSAQAPQARVGKPRPGALVVVDERELVEPLEQAIRRIRRAPATHGARILVISAEDPGAAADDSEFDGAEADDVLLQPQPRARAFPSAGETSLEAVEDGIARLGKRWLHDHEIMDQWLQEAKALGFEVEHALARGDLGQLADQVRRSIEITAWMEATQCESRRVAEKAAVGMEPRNTSELVRDAAKVIHPVYAEVDIRLPPVDGIEPVMCRPALIWHAFRLVLTALAWRIGRRGLIRIEIECGAVHTLHRFVATPATDVPLRDVPPHLVERMRRWIVEEHGGRLFPGASGVAGAEIVVALPSQRGDFSAAT